MGINRFDVYLVRLDPTIGSEINKSRPCLVISPNEMNQHIRTVIVAPMTTQQHKYPSRISCFFLGKDGSVILDQIRTVDKSRLIKKMGTIDPLTRRRVLTQLRIIFDE